MIHDLKTWPDVFESIWIGDKVHEYRVNDRDFKVGDYLRLKEWEPSLEACDEGLYTGRVVFASITFVNTGPEWGIPFGYAVMSIRVINRKSTT